jgi:hypothetical protein
MFVGHSWCSLLARGGKLVEYRQLTSLIRKVKIHGPCLKPLRLTIVTSSLPLWFHPRDEWAKSGNLLKTLPFLPLRNNVSHFSHDFTLSLDILLHFLTILLPSVSKLSIFLCLPGLLGRSQCVPGSFCDRLSRQRFSWVSPLCTQMMRWLLLCASHAALPN